MRAALTIVACILAGCVAAKLPETRLRQAPRDFDWRLPPGFPAPAVPADNPMSAAKVELGRALFYDQRLSFNGAISCASCHSQPLGFSDGHAHAIGALGEAHPRSSMAHIQERYRRLDQYNIQLTVTVDDPKFYTKPWTFMRANFYWMKAQEFAETLCVASEAIEYRDTLAKPSGVNIVP